MSEIIERLRASRDKGELLLLRHELEQISLANEKRAKELDQFQESLSSVELSRLYSVEYNSQCYASFFATTLEKDKSILTLSVGGLGFLVTYMGFMFEVGFWGYCLFVLAAISYLVCIFNVLVIFDKNAKYIISLTQDDPAFADQEIRLRKLDKIAMVSFYLGVLLSFALGGLSSFNKIRAADLGEVSSALLTAVSSVV